MIINDDLTKEAIEAVMPMIESLLKKKQAERKEVGDNRPVGIAIHIIAGEKDKKNKVEPYVYSDVVGIGTDYVVVAKNKAELAWEHETSTETIVKKFPILLKEGDRCWSGGAAYFCEKIGIGLGISGYDEEDDYFIAELLILSFMRLWTKLVKAARNNKNNPGLL